MEADRDYGAGFMARKREEKSLKVRESLARYVLRDAVRMASTSVAASNTGACEWREEWTAVERKRRNAARGMRGGSV